MIALSGHTKDKGNNKTKTKTRTIIKKKTRKMKKDKDMDNRRATITFPKQLQNRHTEGNEKDKSRLWKDMPKTMT